MIDRPGRWTLPELGASEFDVPLRKSQPRVTIPYRLRPGARQGDGLRYVIRLHFVIHFERGNGAGTAWLSAVTNDYAGIQVKFKRDSGR